MVDENDALKPGERVGAHYEVLRTLGAGGMGLVVAARHLTTGNEVAIKVLSKTAMAEGEAVARFLREGRAASVLRSPHAVRLLDSGTMASGTPFLVMELLRGRDLGAVLDAQGPLPLGEVADLLIQACHAIAEAHDRGIVHRDLKPSNLFVVEVPGQPPLVKVLDFGISKFMSTADQDNSLTGTRTSLGTPSYMSPEQVRNSKRVDTRTDLWSLGVMLQELLTGKPPFEAMAFSALCAAIIADPPIPLREVWPEAPDDIATLVARCLEKDPARRLATVAEFVEVLRPYTHSQLPSAPRVSVVIRADAPTLAPDEPLPSTERPPAGPPSSTLSAPAATASGAREVSGRHTNPTLSGVASSRGEPGAPRSKAPLLAAAVALGALGAAATFWPRSAPSPQPAASLAPAVTSSPSPAQTPSAAAPAATSAAPSAPAPASAAPTALASASAAPAEPPGARPTAPAAKPPTKGKKYSPTDDDRKL